ncbi:MAG: bifunctional folylpolyglutamate synthase/dihydrofolate synthase [Candidatus Micrarchaeota archaeon]|nr:bifunctional folylpolyglutamate synthase/dihydrofolate synthase [Candidatus Micrarchaeota archaeon]
MPSEKTIFYSSVLNEIYALDKFGSQLGLGRISKMLALLSHPEQRYKCILVGGSNGKGSTVEMIGSILKADGKRVGTYFSPQIEEFPERFRVNGKNASSKEIASAYSAVKEVCSAHSIPATFFEVVTAMALVIFARRRVDFAVLEVGLGGRLDAVNAVSPEISAIASISLEHTDVLGKTIPAIAHEKCGIARKGRKLVCGIMNVDAKAAVKHECSSRGTRPLFVEESVKLDSVEEKNGCYSFEVEYGGKRHFVSLAAPGKFQVSNALVALIVCSEIGCRRAAIEKGLKNAEPKYRMQQLSANPLIIADCAHNPEAAVAFSGEVKEIPIAGKRVLLFSAMKDKDYSAVLRILAPCFDEVMLTEVPLARGARLAELKKAAAKAGIKAFAARNASSALSMAKKKAGRNGMVAIAGSIYLLAELFGKEGARIAQ